MVSAPLSLTSRGIDRLLREPKVQHLHVPLPGHHDVGRLQVAVDHSPAVGFLERLGELGGEVHDLADGQQLAAGGDLQRLALDVLHDDERAAVGVADLVDLADERMVKRRGGERFAPQALTRDEVLLVVRMEPLDRDAPFEPDVVGEKDLPHPAGAERGVDAVPAGKQIGHLRSRDGMDERLNHCTINRRSPDRQSKIATAESGRSAPAALDQIARNRSWTGTANPAARTIELLVRTMPTINL